MKINNKIFWLIPVFLVGLGISAFRYSGNGEKERVLMDVVLQGVRNNHFEGREINDSFSESVYKLYLDRTDHSKRFFLKDDITRLDAFKFQLDDEIQQGDYTFFNMAESLFDERKTEVSNYYTQILSMPFNFDSEESIELDPEKTEWPKNKDEMKEAWRKSLKYQVLTRIVDAEESQKKAIENKDTSVIQKSFAELEKEAREKVLKTHNDWIHRMDQIERTDKLSSFMNSIVNVFDPHTEYYPPQDKQDFDINMSGKLEGIGATLQEKDGYIKVSALVPFSPAAKQGQLEAGDLILKVAQAEGEPVDIVDMRIDHAVKLIRGKKGTEVRLTVKKPDGRIMVIPIIRDVVILEDTYAKSAILEAENGKDKVGYIYLPKFYANFGVNEGPNRNCSDDMAKEIAKLKKENITSLIVDLRNNSGGSLTDVVTIGGLFVEKGPMVQVKSRFGPPQVLDDKDTRIQYDGPLVILVNNFSASASEILAAAIQDYNRGIIMGSATTYGKGTVQRFFDLDNMVTGVGQGIKPLGALKITMQKFYRINGGTTQLEGVKSDIIIADAYSYMDLGEKDQEYPLKWDEISPARYTPWKLQRNEIDKICKKSSERIQKNATFSLIKENAERLKRNQDQTLFSLNYKTFVSQQDKLDVEAKKYENIMKEELKGVQSSALLSDQEEHVADTAWAARNNEWLKNLRKDAYLQEAVSVVRDIPK